MPVFQRLKAYLRSYSPQFWLMCLASFLFFASFNMILPELPAYLASFGGKRYTWLYILSFSVVALIARPFSGKLSDNIGRLPVMLFGTLICLLCGCLYPFVNGIAFFFILRMVHGLSVGFTPTGTTAYIADLVPMERRGEAMGIGGITNNIGTTLGPVLGSFIALTVSIDAMFITSAGFALVSVLIFFSMKETLKNKKRFHTGMLRMTRNDFYEPRIWLPATVMVLCVTCSGLVLTVYPDMSVHLGIKNKGLFVSVITLSSISTRFGAGKISDRVGRRLVSLWGSLILAASMLLLACTATKFMFMSSAVLYGIGLGIISPTLFAWAADLAHPENRGRAISTLFMALELGVVAGCILTGLVYHNEFENLRIAFLICALFVLFAVFLLYAKRHDAKTHV